MPAHVICSKLLKTCNFHIPDDTSDTGIYFVVQVVVCVFYAHKNTSEDWSMFKFRPAQMQQLVTCSIPGRGRGAQTLANF